MRTAYELQALTRAAPTGEMKDASLLLSDLTGHRLFVEAPAGSTLGGAGNMRAWVRHTATGTWCRAPEFDVAVTTTVQGQCFPDVESVVRQADRLFYAADAVTLAGTPTAPSEVGKVKVYLYGEGRP
jgi:hypothetical protein